MIDYQVLIDGEDYTSSCALPYKEQYVLDSALDNGTLTIWGIKRKEKFKPYTKITITRGNEEPYTFDIFTDRVVEVVGTDIYNHELVLIEETKELEKKVVDTNTTTQPITHNFEEQVELTPSILVWDGLHTPQKPIQGNVLSPIQTNYSQFIPAFQEIYTMSFVTWVRNWSAKILDENGNVLRNMQFPDVGEYYSFSQPGIYTIKYQWESNTGLAGNVAGLCEFKFWVIDPNEIKSKKSITYVVNRLLAITETLRASETPALVFNEEQAQFYENVEAPEFSMTKSTLRECLDQIGGYIHSIVRLEGNTIYFDKLGGTTETELPEDYIGHYETLDSEQYASQLDSIVDNLVNIDDSLQGTLVEPFARGYETVRASGTIRIGDGENATSIIETEYPIEKIHKVICGYLKYNNTDYYIGDITSYIYENAEYQTLSGTIASYPYSKAYALTYTQGQKNISGLTFKIPNAINAIFSHQAIINILEAKTGLSLQSLLTIQKITELNFQIIYYPSVTARVKQSKDNLNEFDKEFTSIYNQGSNKVDSRAYGENLKGAIARLGNVEKFITFTIKPPKDLPEVGNYVIIDNENYYIATLNIENLTDYIKITAGLSKDFNALSKYIGIKNNIRLYEVSEKQSVERFITYEDYCVIGDEITSDNLQLITSQAITNMKYQFNGAIDVWIRTFGSGLLTHIGYSLTEDGQEMQLQQGITYNIIGASSVPLEEFIGRQFIYNGTIAIYINGVDKINTRAISVARLKGYDDKEKGLIQVDLPVFSLGIGNSIWLGCRYHDNYSAGNTSETGLLNDGDYYRVQNYVPYGDNWGELETLEVKMFDYLDYNIGSTEDIIEVGNTLPKSKIITTREPLIDTNNDRLVIKKDSRENLNLSYQCHFVTNQEGIIIGSQLTQGNPLVSNFKVSSSSLYILNNRINKFANDIDLTNATLIKNYNGNMIDITTSNNSLIFNNETATTSGKSWVVVDNATHKLLFGRNIAIENGNMIEMPKMTFTHKVIRR